MTFLEEACRRAAEAMFFKTAVPCPGLESRPFNREKSGPSTTSIARAQANAWQANLEAGIAGDRNHIDCATMLADDAHGGVEPQPGPFAHALGSEERLEDVRLDVRGNAGSGI